jgi:hypothetical protein
MYGVGDELVSVTAAAAAAADELVCLLIID